MNKSARSRETGRGLMSGMAPSRDKATLIFSVAGHNLTTDDHISVISSPPQRAASVCFVMAGDCSFHEPLIEAVWTPFIFLPFSLLPILLLLLFPPAIGLLTINPNQLALPTQHPP